MRNLRQGFGLIELPALFPGNHQLKGMIQTPAVRQILTILVIIFGVYLLLTIIYFIQRMHHLHTLRRARKERAASRARQEAQWLDVPREEEPAGYIDEPPARYAEPEEEDYEDEVPEEPSGRYGGRHAGGARRAAPPEEEEYEDEAPEDAEPEEDDIPGIVEPGDDIDEFFRHYKL